MRENPETYSKSFVAAWLPGYGLAMFGLFATIALDPIAKRKSMEIIGSIWSTVKNDSFWANS